MSLSKIFLRFSSSPNVISLKGNGVDGFAVVAVVGVVGVVGVVDILDGSFSGISSSKSISAHSL